MSKANNVTIELNKTEAENIVTAVELATRFMYSDQVPNADSLLCMRLYTDAMNMKKDEIINFELTTDEAQLLKNACDLLFCENYDEIDLPEEETYNKICAVIEEETIPSNNAASAKRLEEAPAL